MTESLESLILFEVSLNLRQKYDLNHCMCDRDDVTSPTTAVKRVSKRTVPLIDLYLKVVHISYFLKNKKIRYITVERKYRVDIYRILDNM